MPQDLEGLPHVRSAGPEREQLVEFLDYFRAVLRRKAEGLSDADLHRPLPVSSLTIGGLIRHMTLVEDIWFPGFMQDTELEPWASAPWREEADWELTTAAEYGAADLLAAYDEACARSRAIQAEYDSLDVLAKRQRGDPAASTPDLRWIMLHMIEEYARHCGHADFLREAIDGQVGD